MFKSKQKKAEQVKPAETVVLSVDLLERILGYIGSKPFVEVQPLFTAIQQELAGKLKPPAPMPVEEPAVDQPPA